MGGVAGHAWPGIFGLGHTRRQKAAEPGSSSLGWRAAPVVPAVSKVPQHGPLLLAQQALQEGLGAALQGRRRVAERRRLSCATRTIADTPCACRDVRARTAWFWGGSGGAEGGARRHYECSKRTPPPPPHPHPPPPHPPTPPPHTHTPPRSPPPPAPQCQLAGTLACRSATVVMPCPFSCSLVAQPTPGRASAARPCTRRGGMEQ